MATRWQFESQCVPAHALLPITVHFKGLHLKIRWMEHGTPQRAKGRTSGINYHFTAEIQSQADKAPLTCGPQYESLRKSSDRAAIDDAAPAKAAFGLEAVRAIHPPVDRSSPCPPSLI
jgi:hypothetical protein